MNSCNVHIVIIFEEYMIYLCVFSREVAGNFSNSNVETQPPMMSFKAFLGTQEDTITDEEAIKRYNEYKLEFRRQQLNEFFVAHKDEEWYINSYILLVHILSISVVASLYSVLNNFIVTFLIDNRIDFYSGYLKCYLVIS